MVKDSDKFFYETKWMKSIVKILNNLVVFVSYTTHAYFMTQLLQVLRNIVVYSLSGDRAYFISSTKVRRRFHFKLARNHSCPSYTFCKLIFRQIASCSTFWNLILEELVLFSKFKNRNLELRRRSTVLLIDIISVMSYCPNKHRFPQHTFGLIEWSIEL